MSRNNHHRRRHRGQVIVSDRVITGIEASRRVGWARFYAEQERAEKVIAAVDDLIESVLSGHRGESFALAYKLWYLIHSDER